MPQTPFTNLPQYRDKERHHDIYLGMGYSDITTVRIRVPEKHAGSKPTPNHAASRSRSALLAESRSREGADNHRTAHTHTRRNLSPRNVRPIPRFIVDVPKAFNANIVLKKQ